MNTDTKNAVESIKGIVAGYERANVSMDDFVVKMRGEKLQSIVAYITSLEQQLMAAERRAAAAVRKLEQLFEHIDGDEYLRKEFCVHPGDEDCPSEAKNGYVDVDDCVGCPLFQNSYCGVSAETIGGVEGEESK